MSVQLHPPQQTIVSLAMTKLYPHPDNPNRISQAKFKKLCDHIQSSRHYEPLVVRRHPSMENAYQILNGHHRFRALKHLRYTAADCVIFEADNEQARLYLLSLNRLCGRDNVYKKARLIEQLCKTHTSRQLAKRLGDTKTTIEKLNRLAQNQPLPQTHSAKPELMPMTFFLNEQQHTMLRRAFASTEQTRATVTHTQRRIDALMRIITDYLEKADGESASY